MRRIEGLTRNQSFASKMACTTQREGTASVWSLSVMLDFAMDGKDVLEPAEGLEQFSSTTQVWVYIPLALLL